MNTLRASGPVLSLFLFVSIVGCANTRALPVASAVMVHACGAAEADMFIRQSRSKETQSMSKVTIHVETGDEIDVGIKGTAGDATTAGGEANAAGSRKATKWVEVELIDLPSFKQCLDWGYVPQLLPNGCFRWTKNTNGARICRPSSPRSEPGKDPILIQPSSE